MFFEKIIYQNQFIKKYTKKQIGVIVSDFYTFLFFASAPECSFVKKADSISTFVRFSCNGINTNTPFCCTASARSRNAFCMDRKFSFTPTPPSPPSKRSAPCTPSSD